MNAKLFRRIEFMTYIDSDIDRVYQTLTTSEGWDSWFTQGTVLDLEKKTIHFKWKDLGPLKVNGDERCKIMSFKRNELFSFSWHGDSLPRPTTVTIRVRSQGKGTILTVTDEGYPKSDKGEDMFMDCSAGWGEGMTLLKVYLETGYRYRNVEEESEPLDLHH